VIECTGVGLALGGTTILSGVDLSGRSGQVTGLIGPNGSGKSTLLRCLYGVLRADRGAVLIDGEAITSMSRRRIARALAVVAQDATADSTDIAVGEYVLLGRHPHRPDHHGFTAEDEATALLALQRVDMADRARRSLTELSGGERQRVMIARCLAQQCPTLLLDEPTNHLDIHFQHDVLTLLHELALTTVVVLHDLNLAAQFCDYLVLLDGGVVAAEGPPDAVLRPEILQPVYGITIRRVDLDGGIYLAFGSPPTRRQPAMPTPQVQPAGAE
jgi:iron complex transport system ATP-binding protein